MSGIKCLVCGGEHFRKGYYEIDVNVTIYPDVHNDVNVSTRSFDDVEIDVDVKVDSTISNEIVENGDIYFNLISEEHRGYSRNDKISDVYKYVCEDCGFIMSFINEKKSESKFEQTSRKQRENTYDWSNFGKR